MVVKCSAVLNWTGLSIFIILCSQKKKKDKEENKVKKLHNFCKPCTSNIINVDSEQRLNGKKEGF